LYGKISVVDKIVVVAVYGIQKSIINWYKNVTL